MRGRRRSGIVVAIVGAGSSYSPMIVNELFRRQVRLPVAEVRLYDINRDRLRTVAGFCRRLIDSGLPIATPASLAKAVEGADFVLSQFRVGGLQARHRDIKLGLKYGLIGQETTGVGGYAKALRTIPATLKVCGAMRRHAAKGAWLVNFTNPSGIITETVLKHGGVNVVGLCNGPLGVMRRAAQALKVRPQDVVVDYVGANHLGWVRSVRVNGRDRTAAVRRRYVTHKPKNIPYLEPNQLFERALGAPYSSYLKYYYYTDAMFRTIAERKRSRAQEALAIERTLLRKYADPRVRQIPAELSKRGGGGYNLVAADVIEALVNDLGTVHIVNVRNAGTIHGVQEDQSVEVTCRVGRNGARPMFPGSIPAHMRGLLQVVKAYEELAVEAGVTGDLEAALHALVIHPLGPTAEQAGDLLRDLLRVNRAYLPQFGEKAVARFFKGEE
ncbi:MAG: 6-phospho-beta-glucosidase [Kiritimatiellae bacterium]|nr:6-phospho-beta-glucosidase [Kiritimatiellia bacterium]